MEYFKKILVLKEIENGYSSFGKPISGICQIEKENDVCTFHFSVINVSAKALGEFYLFFFDGNKKIFSYPLGKRPFSFNGTFYEPPVFSDKFAAGLCYVSGNIPIVIAYYGENFSVYEFKDKILKKFIAEKEENDNDNESEKKRIPFTPTPVKPPINPLPTPNPQNPAPPTEFPSPKNEYSPYDDEAVATENYYENDDILNFNYGENKNVRDKNGVFTCGVQNQTQKIESFFNGGKNEDDDKEGKNYNERSPYYKTVEKELTDLFDGFPEEETLSKNLPESKWVKINYSENKYYVVGLIYKNKKEKYICYGVPSEYSKNPPKELKGFCSFIPLSVFDMKGKGYWMMFQDAVTGECVKI